MFGMEMASLPSLNMNLQSFERKKNVKKRVSVRKPEKKIHADRKVAISDVFSMAFPTGKCHVVTIWQDIEYGDAKQEHPETLSTACFILAHLLRMYSIVPDVKKRSGRERAFALAFLLADCKLRAVHQGLLVLYVWRKYRLSSIRLSRPV